MSTREPVVVVGGGIAGLTAALKLQERGIPVRVYEGLPKVGGRICSVEDQGVLETGMQFYYSSYREAFSLLRQFGLERDLVPIHVRGLMYSGGDVRTFDKAWPWLGLLTAPENLRLQSAVARRVLALLTMTPFDYKAGDPLDRIDCAEYFEDIGGKQVLELAIRPMVTSYAFTEPEGHSLAMLLRILRLGAFSKMYGLVGGNDSLPRKMAEKLDVVHQRVVEIIVEEGQVRGVVVEGPEGTETVRTSHVVSAVRGSQAGELLPGAPLLAGAFDELTYSTIVLANLHLDTTLTGPDWTYILSRADGHRAAFGVDLMRRSPTMFPDGKSVLQVNFADPTSSALLNRTDDDICQIAIEDMTAFLPGLADKVRHTSVVRRPRALPSFTTGMFDKIRRIEGMAGEIRGLHLAGDYLRAPLCEGAVRSGIAAANAVADELRTATPLPLQSAMASNR